MNVSPAAEPDKRIRNHNDEMAIRVRLLFAGACAALAVAGCSAAATEDKKAEAPTATGSSMTVAPDEGAKADGDPAPAISDPQQQAQQLAEEAEKIMLDPALAPREKYPKALGMFRDALEIDPSNALAAASITLIEDIYKSMGRPVPAPA